MSANNLPADDEESFCAKRGKIRSENRFRQAAPLARAQGGSVFQPLARSKDSSS